MDVSEQEALRYKSQGAPRDVEILPDGHDFLRCIRSLPLSIIPISHTSV
jgi:hypothetical protein